jgi:6-phosphogluconolactonase (cycloisomerase 2 family)
MSRRRVPDAAVVAAALGLILTAGCGGSSRSAAASASAPVPLALTSVTPTSGIVGTTVVVSGTGLGAAQGASVISFGGVTATVTAWSATSLTAVVPAGAFPGRRDVMATVAGTASNTEGFTVALPPCVYISDGEFGTRPETIAGFAVTTTAAGALTLTALPGSPFSTLATGGAGFEPGDAQAVKVHAGSRHLLATAGDAVVAFDIDGASGALTLATGSPLVLRSGAIFDGIAVDPAGAHAYAVDNNDATPGRDIYALAVSTTGQVSQLAGSPANTTLPALDIPVLARDGLFLFAQDETTSGIVGFGVAASGTLTALPGSPFGPPAGLTAGSTQSLYVDPSGTHIYQPFIADGKIAGFDVDATSGTLTAIAGSPFTVTTNAYCMAFSPDGKRAYITAGSAGGSIPATPEIRIFDVGPDGSLTAATVTASIVTSAQRSGMAVSSDGTLLFTVNSDVHSISVLAISPTDGSLTELPGSPFPTPPAGVPFENPNSIAITR